MLEINGHKFAKNDSEFMSSLFHGKSTCYGYYEQRKNSIILSNHEHEVFAAVVCNPKFVGVVNANKQTDGQIFYQYGLSEDRATLLGVPEKLSDQDSYAKKIWGKAVSLKQTKPQSKPSPKIGGM